MSILHRNLKDNIYILLYDYFEEVVLEKGEEHINWPDTSLTLSQITKGVYLDWHDKAQRELVGRSLRELESNPYSGIHHDQRNNWYYIRPKFADYPTPGQISLREESTMLIEVLELFKELIWQIHSYHRNSWHRDEPDEKEMRESIETEVLRDNKLESLDRKREDIIRDSKLRLLEIQENLQKSCGQIRSYEYYEYAEKSKPASSDRKRPKDFVLPSRINEIKGDDTHVNSN